jgi:hypothetical protein
MHVKQTGWIGEFPPHRREPDNLPILLREHREVPQVRGGAAVDPVGSPTGAGRIFPLGTGGQTIPIAIEAIGGYDDFSPFTEFITRLQSLLRTEPIQVQNGVNPVGVLRKGCDALPVSGYSL